MQKASTLNFPITVNQEETTYSPYITSVPEYKPAPGQFINELPKYEIGDTQSTMNRKALESIGYNTRILISLGGYGGYVICGFDHTIVNVPGKYDFKVLGNAFYANSNPNPNAPEEGGSCEPGIVMVAYDQEIKTVLPMMTNGMNWQEANITKRKPSKLQNNLLSSRRRSRTC